MRDWQKLVRQHPAALPLGAADRDEVCPELAAHPEESRAGGSLRTALVSSIFPILPFIAAFSVVLPVSLIIDRQMGVTVVATGLFQSVIGWVVIPGMTLLAGGLLAEFFLSRRAAPAEKAIS